VLFMEAGRIVLDAPRSDALAWLAANRPLYLPHAPELVCSVRNVRFAYGDRVVLERASLEVRRGEVVALTGPNGAGKTTLAQIAVGLLEPDAGEVTRSRAAYLAQDPGRHLVTERVLDEVALGGTSNAHAWRSPSSASRSMSNATPATCRPASASGSRWRPCSRPSPSCSCSTSRPGAWTRSASRRSPGCCAQRHRSAALVVTHDLPWAAEVVTNPRLDVREEVRA
jgi:hypothetical protein